MATYYEGKPGQILIWRRSYTNRHGRVVRSKRPIPMWIWPHDVNE